MRRLVLAMFYLDETFGLGDATTSTDTNAANTGGCHAVQRRYGRVELPDGTVLPAKSLQAFL